MGRQGDFPKANARAKRLRRDQTPAEARLWALLRKIEGLKFRRQTPIGPYVFDFCEFERKLVIELDGGIHRLANVKRRDAVKEAWIRSQGFSVLRIPNAYVFGTGEPAVMMVMEEVRRLEAEAREADAELGKIERRRHATDSDSGR